MTIAKGSIAELVHTMLSEDPSAVPVFTQRRWFTNAVGDMRRLRVALGVSQEEMAKRLGTTQSAIARLERDFDGSISLRNLSRYLMALGYMPKAIEFEEMDVAASRTIASLHDEGPSH